MSISERYSESSLDLRNDALMYLCSSSWLSTQAEMTLAFGNFSQTFCRPSGLAMRLRKMMRCSRTPCSRRTSMALMADPPVAVNANGGWRKG